MPAHAQVAVSRYTGVVTCSGCGASAPADASWCGQCYQPLAALVAAAPGDRTASEPDRWGITRPLPCPPVAPALDAVVPVQPTGPGVAAAPPAYDGPRTGALGAWGRGSTGYTVIGAIALGALMQLVMYVVTRKGTVEVEAFVRYALVATLTFYAVVAAIVVHRVQVGGVRLFWTDGRLTRGIATGAAVGLGLGALALAVNSAINGHLTTDPNITLLTSEGDGGHIVATVLITMVAAPLVEETLFRGLLAESLRPRGRAAAIWLSALAFAAWHLNPAALRYYALMGALLGLLYWQRGLVCSVVTHACFNGTLTVAAVVLALSPGHAVTVDGLTLHAPTGWHQEENLPADAQRFTALSGPSHATVLVSALPTTAGAATVDELARRIDSGEFDQQIPAAAGVTHSAPVRRHLPVGDVVAVTLMVKGHEGQLVWLPSPTRLYLLVLETNGSVKAKQDFERMLTGATLA